MLSQSPVPTLAGEKSAGQVYFPSLTGHEWRGRGVAGWVVAGNAEVWEHRVRDGWSSSTAKAGTGRRPARLRCCCKQILYSSAESRSQRAVALVVRGPARPRLGVPRAHRRKRVGGASPCQPWVGKGGGLGTGKMGATGRDPRACVPGYSSCSPPSPEAKTRGPRGPSTRRRAKRGSRGRARTPGVARPASGLSRALSSEVRLSETAK